jgi:hypothetical protein
MNRETKRIIEFGKDKKVVRAAIRREFAAAKAVRQPHLFALPFDVWLRSQPASTRKGVSRGNFKFPRYVV